MRCSLLLPVILLLFAGCTTFTSTMLHRHENDILYKNEHLKLKGVPITVKVPSHLDVRITESYLLGKTEKGLEELPIPGGPARGVTTTIVKSEKIFVVDFKRPASGTLEYELGFNEEQYLTKIANRIEDTTIADVRGLVTSAIPLFTGAPTSASTVTVNPSLSNLVSEGTREVAFRRFDLDSPCFEEELNWFVDRYITNCNNCYEFYPPGPSAVLLSESGVTNVDDEEFASASEALDFASPAEAPGTHPFFEDDVVTVYSDSPKSD